MPFFFGSVTYLYSRWVVSRKKRELLDLLVGFRKYLNKIDCLMSNEGWDANSKFILETLKRIESEQTGMKKSFNKEITSLKVQVATLNVKSGIFGFIGSALAIVIALGLTYLKSA